MLNVIMLSFIVLNVVAPSVVMLSVVSPNITPEQSERSQVYETRSGHLIPLPKNISIPKVYFFNVPAFQLTIIFASLLDLSLVE